MTPIQSLTDRSQLGKWLTENGLTGIGVEVGVKDGENARQWISTWPGLLHLVDVWAPQDPKVYAERQDWTDFDACYKKCQDLAREFIPRVFLQKKLSLDAAKMFPNEYFDAFYLDCNHAFEPAFADMNAWWPKVKRGGLFSGHDDYIQRDDTKICEVRDALRRFCKEKGLTYHRTNCTSWWIVKP